MDYLIIKIFAFIVVLNSIQAKEVCYDDLGCFKDTRPFGFTFFRPIGVLPQSPEKIDTTFKLYNKNIKSGKAMNSNSIPGGFISSIPTKVIIHGFQNSEDSDYVVEMRNVLLDSFNVNVIVVDWKDGNSLSYEQSANNGRVVGAVTANLIKVLVAQKGAKASDFHLIGFSLGAQIAGYAGERIKVGRISGLDPAGPYFEGTPAEVRLDSSDADFVDVIHTNAGVIFKELGFGMLAPVGHVDFYPNGGKTQPGCAPTNTQLWDSISSLLESFDLGGAADDITCSHSYAHKYFIDSIKDTCTYTAYPSKSMDEFNNGNVENCSNGCNRMGYYASKNKERGSLYLVTGEDLKCKKTYQIQLESDSKGSKGGKGDFKIYLQSSTGEISSTENLDDSQTKFTPSSINTKLITFEKPLSQKIDQLYISYKRDSGYEYRWNFKTVEVYSVEDQYRIKLCPRPRLFGSRGFTEYIQC